VARSYAAIHLRIWADPDWRHLDVDAQHLYLLLISQPQMNLAGVLPLQTRKWASCVAGWDVSIVEKALHALTDTGFLVVDEDTEEVLVRTFIRNDGGYRTPGPLKSILRVAETIQGPRLRKVLADELGKLPPLDGKKTAADGMAAIAATRLALDPMADAMPDGIRDAIGDPISIGRHPRSHVQRSLDAIPDASGSGSGSGSGASLVETVVGEGESGLHPPRCDKHNRLPYGDEPPCKVCKRMRERWEAEQVKANEPKPKPPWCGRCSDPNRRQLETPVGIIRCPECHPLAAQETP
jgi:hypothetical protein